MSEQSSPERIEGIKLLYDYLKHLTTLSTGAIVLLATFLGNRQQPIQTKELATASVICFIACIVGNALAAGVYVVRAEEGDFSDIKGTDLVVAGIGFLGGALAFIAAMICLSIFAIKNF